VVEWYAKLLAGLRTSCDRALFLIASFCALRPSEIFGLTWGSYQGSTFKVMNTAWHGQFQPKKIKRKNRYGRTNYRWVAIPEAVRRAIDEWGREVRDDRGKRTHVFRHRGARAQAAG
jgi:hypothetical protein